MTFDTFELFISGIMADARYAINTPRIWGELAIMFGVVAVVFAYAVYLCHKGRYDN